MKRIFFNIIQKEKFLVWLPEKTGSIHAFKVLQNYGISSFELINNELIEIGGFGHDSELFDGHENFSIVSTARNPYSKFVSYYKYFGIDKNGWDFYDYLYKSILEKPFKILNYNERIPDYFIRQENIFEDYLKIPFVKKSEFYRSGQLEDLCNNKINHNENSYDYREYYNQENADLVYYSFSKYFDLLGYEKNSWKK